MPPGLHTFGLVHIAILCSIPAFAALLATAHRRFPAAGPGIRIGLSVLLAVATGSYFGSFVVSGVGMFPNHMPLDLCDFSIWLTVAALLTLRPGLFDVAYYWAIAGAGMSVLTPNITVSSPFLATQYFVDHGAIVAAVLYLVWSGQARPRAGSVLKAMLWLNVAAALVGPWDYFFGTDYMYLRAKPQNMSLMDVMGPWPWYILSCEGVGLVLFGLLYLPFWRGGKAVAAEEAA